MSSISKPNHQHLPFFVYGTLLPGQPNFFLWRDEIVRNQPASFMGGLLYDMGNYPMLVEADSGVVQGRLIHLAQACQLEIMRSVDALEGFDQKRPDASIYQRVLREICTPDGDQLQAWVYVGQAKYVAGAPLIEGGNWVHYVRSNLIEISNWWRNIDSVSALGKS